MLESLIGIYPTFGSVPGNMHNSPNRALRAQKGWVKEPQVVSGQTVENALVIQLWKSPEAEKELENQDPLSFERWRSELEKIDPLFMKEERCDLVPIHPN